MDDIEGYTSHPSSICETDVEIGQGSYVGAFAHLATGVKVGKHCIVGDRVLIEMGATIGDNARLMAGSILSAGVVIGDEVCVGPNAVILGLSDIARPKIPNNFKETILGHRVIIGANAVVLPGVRIGAYALVGAGSVVTRDVPSHCVVAGNPARIQGYDAMRTSGQPVEREALTTAVVNVSTARIIPLPRITDMRGRLTFGELDSHLPFLPKRYFVVFDVPTIKARGEHAHKTLHQFLVCLRGSCNVVVDDGKDRFEVLLDTPEKGLYIPPMIWATQYRYTADAMLLVLASEKYDASDYIRDYDEFLKEVDRKNVK